MLATGSHGGHSVDYVRATPYCRKIRVLCAGSSACDAASPGVRACESSASSHRPLGKAIRLGTVAKLNIASTPAYSKRSHCAFTSKRTFGFPDATFRERLLRKAIKA